MADIYTSQLEPLTDPFNDPFGRPTSDNPSAAAPLDDLSNRRL